MSLGGYCVSQKRIRWFADSSLLRLSLTLPGLSEGAYYRFLNSVLIFNLISPITQVFVIILIIYFILFIIVFFIVKQH